MRTVANTIDNSRSGYTLIELAVVAIVVGVLLALGASSYKLYKMEQDRTYTEVSRARIVGAIDSFRIRYGRYPCPARYDVDRAHPDYGMEGTCTDTSVPAGECDQGICVETGARSVELADGTIITPRVRRGAIPFRVLDLSEDDAYDSYENRFSYAVSENLTRFETFDVAGGAIAIVDGSQPVNQSLVTPEGSGLYFLFSPGEDRVGAYDRDGNQILPCDGPMLDVENCNTEIDATAIYRVAEQSDVPIVIGGVTLPPPGPGPSPPVTVNMHYDDYASFKGSDQKPLWKVDEVNPVADNVHDLLNEEAVTIGGATGTQKLNVNDRIRASETVRGVRLCDDAGNCFEPDFIGGEGDSCTDGFSGISYENLDCEAPAIGCPSDQYMRGFDPVTHIPDCRVIPTTIYCEARNVTLCGQSRTLTRSRLNTILTITAGASRARQYQCRQSGNSGTWVVLGGDTGVCNCTASSNTVTNGATSCGTGYTGRTTTTTTTVCPSGTTTTVTDRAACVCQPGTETRTLSCPTNQVGAITQSRNITCTGNTANVGPWTQTSNTCVCEERAPQTRPRDCPAYHTGNITETRNWNRTTCSWDGWVQTQNTCTCQVTTEYRYSTCYAPLTGQIRQERQIQCPSGTPTPWYEISNNCACRNTTESRTVACPDSTHTGSIRQERTVDCYGNPVAGASGTWTQVANTCAPPPTCSWSAGDRVGPGGTGPLAPSVCACGTPNRSCRVTIPGGGTDSYNNCRCE